MIHYLYGLFSSRRTLKHKPQKSTVYRETPLKSTVAEETELKRGTYNVLFTIKTSIYLIIDNIMLEVLNYLPVNELCIYLEGK